MKKSETGRSVVELLCVLVIMLLIAWGGIQLWIEAKFDAQVQIFGKQLQAIKNRRLLSMNAHSNERLAWIEKGPYDSVFSIENGIGPQNKDWFWIAVKTSNSSLCAFLTEYEIDAGFINDDCETNNEVTFYFLKFPENKSEDIPNKDNQPKECPENMICNDDFEPIGCKENYFLYSGNCTKCPENNSICENDTLECLVGYYKEGTDCISCGLNVLSCDEEGNLIQCKEGFYQNNNSCIPCPTMGIASCNTTGFTCQTGYYKNDNTCIECPEHYETCDNETGDFTCQAGYYKNENQCIFCDELSEYSLGGNTTSCSVCNSGQKANEQHTACVNCDFGERCTCPDETPYADGNGACLEEYLCPQYSSTNVVEGNQILNTLCYCESGYTLNQAQTACCPENSSTTVREGNQAGDTDCYCNEGYYWNSENLRCEENMCPENSSPILRCDNIIAENRCSVDDAVYKYYKSPKDGCFCKENYVVQKLITGIELEDEFCELYQCYEPSSSWSRSDLVSAQARLNNSGSSNWCRITSEALGNSGVDGISRDGNVRYYGRTNKLESPIVLGNFNGLDFYIRPERAVGGGTTWMGAYTYCQATGGRMVSLNDLIAVGLCPADIRPQQNCTPLNNIFAAQDTLFYWLDDDCKTSVDGSTYYGVACESNPSSNSYYGLCYASSNGYINSQMRIGNGWDFRNTALCVKETSHITCNRENYELDINGNCNCKSGYASGDSNGICLKKCENNSQCAQDEYCQISSWTTGTSDDNYFTNISGFCRDKGELPASKTIEGIETWNFGKVNWWNANNLCQAHGKRLFTIEELQCYVPNSSTQINSENVSEQYCCQSNKSCGQTTNTDTFSPIANGIVSQYKIYPWILSSSDNQVSKKSLYLYYQNRYVWNSSTSSYTTDSYQYYKKLNYMDRNTGSYVGGYALCRD